MIHPACRPSPSRQLDPVEQDAVREICSIGVSQAATALSRMISDTVELKIPSVHLLNLAAVPDFIGGPEHPSAGILLGMNGDARGEIMLIFPLETAFSLTALLTGAPSPDHCLDDSGRSALNELGNILASSYLNGLSALLGLTILPTVPSLGIDMAGALLDPILSRQCSSCDTSLVVTTEFWAERHDVSGKFYIMPDPGSLDVILAAAGLRHG